MAIWYIGPDVGMDPEKLRARITKLETLTRNQRKEIRALNRKIDIINEYAKNGVFTHFHRSIVSKLNRIRVAIAAWGGNPDTRDAALDEILKVLVEP